MTFGAPIKGRGMRSASAVRLHMKLSRSLACAAVVDVSEKESILQGRTSLAKEKGKLPFDLRLRC